MFVLVIKKGNKFDNKLMEKVLYRYLTKPKCWQKWYV